MTAKNQTKQSRRAKGEGTIFRKGDRWVGRLTYEDPETGIRKRGQVSATTKKAAAAELKKLRERVEKGHAPRDATATFGAYAEQWIGSTLEVSDRKQSTKSLYASLTRSHIIGSPLGETALGKVTPPAVERWITHLRGKGLAASSVRQAYTIARAIGDAAVRDKLVTENPFSVVKRPKVERVEAPVLTSAQVATLLEAASDSRYRLLFALLVNTGMRRGEALALKWSDVDLTNARARVKGTLVRQSGELTVTSPKSEKSKRTVPLSAPAVEVLRAVKKRTAEDRLRAANKWHDSGYVFVTEFGEPCDPRNALRALQAAAEKTDLGRVGLHTLRHTAATLMLTNGVPMPVVSQVMGHSGIAITVDTYGHVSPDVSAGALDVLAGALKVRG